MQAVLQTGYCKLNFKNCYLYFCRQDPVICVEMWMWSAEWCERVALATMRRMGCRRPSEGAVTSVRSLLVGGNNQKVSLMYD